MKLSRRALWLAPVAVLASLFPTRADQAPKALAPPALDISVSVGPTGAGRTEFLARPTQTFDCAFRVLEPGTQNLYVERFFTVPVGGRSSASASNEGLQFKFSAAIDQEGTRVMTDTFVSHASGPTSHYRSTLWLPRGTRSRDKDKDTP